MARAGTSRETIRATTNESHDTLAVLEPNLESALDAAKSSDKHHWAGLCLRCSLVGAIRLVLGLAVSLGSV